MRFLPAKRIALARFLTGDTLTVTSSVFSCSSAIEVGAWGYQKRSACRRDYARRRVSWATFIYNTYILDNNFAIIKYVNSRRFPHLAEVLVKILVHLHLSNLLKCSTHSWSESIKAAIISAAVIAFSASRCNPLTWTEANSRIWWKECFRMWPLEIVSYTDKPIYVFTLYSLKGLYWVRNDGFRNPLTSTIINTILIIFTIFRFINTRDLITPYVF